MNKRTWMIVGILVVVAGITGYIWKKHSDTSSDTQSQLPAEQAQANYNVPPDIGASVDNTGGINFPQGGSGYIYTTSQGNSLPSNGNGS